MPRKEIVKQKENTCGASNNAAVQSTKLLRDTTSPPPPPPFSIDREVTRVMPVYLNQYRDGRRLPTPEKVAVMELSKLRAPPPGEAPENS
ncbi:hypothetical protein MAR_019371 [Mya arenaria]|uniref:Uncharacterized protein n=1 Tax=Mya arenaria TaxID=6604 RepID=A0ABY7ELA0_MYAAR|nr:hypothetical protein MAR_019371 [Mya arenaria]